MHSKGHVAALGALFGALILLASSHAAEHSNAAAEGVVPSSPPIERPKFRAELLALLIKNAPASARLEDVTARTLHPAFLAYCDMTDAERMEFKLLEISRVTPERYQLFKDRLVQTCNLRIFTQRFPVGSVYVAAYTRTAPEGPAIRIAHRPGHALAVLQSPDPTPNGIIAEAIRRAVAKLRA